MVDCMLTINGCGSCNFVACIRSQFELAFQLNITYKM